MFSKLFWLILLSWILLTACSQANAPRESQPTPDSALTQTSEPAPTTKLEGIPTIGPELSTTAANTPPPLTHDPTGDASLMNTDVPVTLSPTPSNSLCTDQRQSTRNIIFAQLDYEQHYMGVSQSIEYLNQYDVPLSELVFVVEPNRQPGIFNLEELFWPDGEAIEEFKLENARLTISLPTPLLPGSRGSISFKYGLNIPQAYGPFGYTDRQTNLGDWALFVPPFHAQDGWLVHEPAAVGEHLVYETQDFDVELELISRQDDLVVAASGLPERNGNRYRYQIEDARNFTLSISPYYQVSSEQVGSVTVLSYYFPEIAMSGDVVLQATIDALNVYSDIYHPYPFDSLSSVPSEFKDGLEYSGFYFLDQKLYINYNGTYRSFLISIAAHETAHQWWYGIVANDQALEPWLDESFATYSELLFYERIYPEHINWWWQRRVLRFDSDEFVDTTIYDHEDFRSYVDAVYLRGALFLQELRELVGEEVFMGFLKDLQQLEEHELITAEVFWDLLVQHSDENFDQIRYKYFFQ